jgi:hypothetical protein
MGFHVAAQGTVAIAQRRKAPRARSALVVVALLALPVAAISVVGAGSAEALTQPGVRLANDGTSAKTTYTVSMTTGAALPDPATNRITVVAPSGTNFFDSTSCRVTITDDTNPANSGRATCGSAQNNNTAVIYNFNAIGADEHLTIDIDFVTNPSSPMSNAVLQISTSSETTPVTSQPYSIATRSVVSPVVGLASNSPGATTAYTLSFATSAQGALRANYDPRITVVAPNGTQFGSCSASITDQTDPSGSGRASCGTGQNANTLVLFNFNPIGADHQLSIAVSNVVNPTSPSASYTWLVATTSDTTPVESAPFGIGNVPPSPSPSPTAQPQPQPPTVSLSQSVINAGQRVTVTYQGAPGTTLQVLSRTQPATAFSVITTVTLDGAGFGASSHAPQKNTRLTARTMDGVASADQPLIQVRSVASINQQRVGVRTFTFTGRVYPALNQRLVSLYRNGILVAQGRCDASGIYSIRKTLATGTFNFFTRTSNDTYNLGASSRTISVLIY